MNGMEQQKTEEKTKSDANKNENELKCLSKQRCKRRQPHEKNRSIITRRRRCARIKNDERINDERVTLKRLGEQLMITCWRIARIFSLGKKPNRTRHRWIYLCPIRQVLRPRLQTEQPLKPCDKCKFKRLSHYEIR